MPRSPSCSPRFGKGGTILPFGPTGPKITAVHAEHSSELGWKDATGKDVYPIKFADYGIDDNFIKQVRSQVTEGTSALFLMSSGAVQDRIREAVKGQQFELIATNLSAEQEEKLRAAFAEEE